MVLSKEVEVDTPDILMNHIVNLLNKNEWGFKVQFHTEQHLETERTPGNISGHIFLAEEIPEQYAMNGVFRWSLIFTLHVQMRNVQSNRYHGIRRVMRGIARELQRNLAKVPDDWPTTVAFQDMRVVAIRHFDKEEGRRAQEEAEIDIAIQTHESVVFA